MTLPDSYTTKPGSIEAYFDAMLDAEAPQRFSQGFLESLDFKSTNDRAFIRILKDMAFIDTDGVPRERYYQFLDRTQARRVVADGVREAFSDLFAVNKRANELGAEEVKNKLRTLYKGTKKDGLIGRIASTFTALCEYGDFDSSSSAAQDWREDDAAQGKVEARNAVDESAPRGPQPVRSGTGFAGGVVLDSLQYHINIVLPESRDQSVYDAIFKSLRDHLGSSE